MIWSKYRRNFNILRIRWLIRDKISSNNNKNNWLKIQELMIIKLDIIKWIKSIEIVTKVNCRIFEVSLVLLAITN